MSDNPAYSYPDTYVAELRTEIERLRKLACVYCADGLPIDDGDDGVKRYGRYHRIKYGMGGGFVECRARALEPKP